MEIILLVWLVTGGLAGIRHLLLRIELAYAGQLPWRTIRFLNEATRCILLYRDGGGYRFIHYLLLDYFADLAPASPSVLTEGQGKWLVPVQERYDGGE